MSLQVFFLPVRMGADENSAVFFQAQDLSGVFDQTLRFARAKRSEQ